MLHVFGELIAFFFPLASGLQKNPSPLYYYYADDLMLAPPHLPLVGPVTQEMYCYQLRKLIFRGKK